MGAPGVHPLLPGALKSHMSPLSSTINPLPCANLYTYALLAFSCALKKGLALTFDLHYLIAANNSLLVVLSGASKISLLSFTTDFTRVNPNSKLAFCPSSSLR